ncbi:MAG: CHASE2 domain-containing protein [Steroidobacteraceae bacterium]
MDLSFRSLLSRLDAAFRLRSGLALWVPGAVAVMFCVLLACDPLGFEGESEAGSERATLRIAAPFYQPSGDVVAVVIDDDYLFARQSGWPLRYAEQGAILRRILDFQPAAILVDFVYAHRHGSGDARGLDPLARLIDPLRDERIPIVFTALAHSDDRDRCAFGGDPAAAPYSLLDERSLDGELRTWIGEDPQARRIAYVNWSSCGGRYPLMLAGRVDAPTPAFAAYQAFCTQRPQVAGCRNGAESGEAAFVRPLIPRAGAFPPAAQTFSHGADVCQRGAAPDGTVAAWRRLAKSARQLAFSLFGNPRRSADPEISLPCPPVNVVPYSLLANATYEEWQELIGGKLVVLGADVSGIPDVVQTPVHGQLPGAVWHAMVADNLLAAGSGYLRDPPGRLQKLLILGCALLFAYTFPFIASLYDNNAFKQGLAWVSLGFWLAVVATYLWAGRWDIALPALGLAVILDLSKPTYSAAYFLALAASAAISLLLLVMLDMPVGNWLALVFVLAAFTHTMKPFYRRDAAGREPAAKQLPHPRSLLGQVFRRIRS